MRNHQAAPVLAITMGDPAGIGPEIILKALANSANHAEVRLVVVGDQRILHSAAAMSGLPCPAIDLVGDLETHDFFPGHIALIDLANAPPADCPVGQVSAAAGRAAVDYVRRACRLALDGHADAMVTAPLNKAAMHAAGFPYQGHTELLKELTGANRVAMLLTGPKLRVIHVSTHISLKEAVNGLNPDRILAVIRLGQDVLSDLGIKQPRIAVAGLNPHAGEGGIFGTEESDLIMPVILKARALGIRVSDPQPPDTVFFRAAQGDYDLVVAMYHDQGHIPMKLLAFEDGVNVSVGLPIIRTSVDHGTAFDIAGKGQASAQSLLAAIDTALKLVRAKMIQT